MKENKIELAYKLFGKKYYRVKELRRNEIDQSFATLCSQKGLDGNMYPTLLQQIQVVADEVAGKIPDLVVRYTKTKTKKCALEVRINDKEALMFVDVLTQKFKVSLLCHLTALDNFSNNIAVIFNAESNRSSPERTTFDVDNEFLNNHKIITAVLRFVIDKHINGDDKLAKKEPRTPRVVAKL